MADISVARRIRRWIGGTLCQRSTEQGGQRPIRQSTTQNGSNRDRPQRLGDTTDTDRAQLILITGLTLAVLLVAVVLLLNTVIYTENLATRGVDAGGTDAAEFRASTGADVGEMIDRANRDEGATVEFVIGVVETYRDQVRDHRLQDGTVVDVVPDEGSAVTGWYVAQDRLGNDTDPEYRTFTADDEAGTDGANWTLATNVTATRGYGLTIDADSVSELDAAANETFEEDAYTLQVTGTDGSSWSLYVYRTDSDSNVTVTVAGESVESRTVEPVTDDAGINVVQVDITDGTVNGAGWSALRWAEGVEDGSTAYAIAYEHGDRIAGTYELTIKEAGTTDVIGSDDRYGTDPSNTSASPYALDAVYGMEVTVRQHTPTLRFEDRLWVAPGERHA